METTGMRIKELTIQQFWDMTPEEVGFNGRTWEVDVIVVNGNVVLDRYNPIKPRAKKMMQRWIQEKIRCE